MRRCCSADVEPGEGTCCSNWVTVRPRSSDRRSFAVLAARCARRSVGMAAVEQLGEVSLTCSDERCHRVRAYSSCPWAALDSMKVLSCLIHCACRRPMCMALASRAASKHNTRAKQGLREADRVRINAILCCVFDISSSKTPAHAQLLFRDAGLNLRVTHTLLCHFLALPARLITTNHAPAGNSPQSQPIEHCKCYPSRNPYQSLRQQHGSATAL
jgi:hypothetical protein